MRAEEHIDSQAEVKVYRLNPDGSKGEFLRVEPAYPPGWDDPAKRKQVPNYKDLKGEREMTNPNGRPKREAPPKEELLSLYVRHEGKIDLIRKELGCSWAYAKSWLVDAGIIDNWGQPIEQTPTLEPDELGGENRNEGEGESATDSISYSVERIENIGREINPDDDTKIYVPERQNYTITQYNEQVKQGGFTAADEEPAPYTVADEQLSPLASAGNQILVAAWEKITAVVDDPVALPLIKELIRSGVA